MFGKNPTRKASRTDGQTLIVQEMFLSIQGEGPFSGERAVFVRLAGCNLRCYWCDTDFESKATSMDLVDVVAVVDGMATSPGWLVVITGGEPFLQSIGPLCEQLLALGHRVQIETSGTVWQPVPDHPRLSIVLSPKTPKVHLEIEARAFAWKYVVRWDELDAVDFLPTRSTQDNTKAARLARPPDGAVVYVSPCDDRDDTLNQRNIDAALLACMCAGYRLSLQVHKVIGIP